MARGIKVVPSVFIAVIKDGKVVLIRRKNTGWIDGWYDLPAGHLESGETFQECAVRELQEETGLKAKTEDLSLIHVHQNHNGPKAPHYGYIFLAKKWTGEPSLVEPQKSDDIGWFKLDNLPDKISPYVKYALENLGDVPTTSYHGPRSII